MSYFELYNQMRKAAENFRPSANYRVGFSRPNRELPPVEQLCPSCGEPLDRGAKCFLCGVDAVDVAAARVRSFTRVSVLTQAAHRLSLGKLALRREDRALARTFRRSTKGLARLRGRIHVVSPVIEPRTQASVGAYVSRWIDEVPCECREACRAVNRFVLTQSDAGLLVFESEGVHAFVGFAGEPLRILAAPGAALDAPRSAKSGDEVVIVGSLHERPEISVELSQSDYRTQATTHTSLEGPGWLIIDHQR